MSWWSDRHERTQEIIRVLLKHMDPEQQRTAIEALAPDPDVFVELVDALGAGDALVAVADAYKRTN